MYNIYIKFKERHRISLVEYGDCKSYSAMSRTVGYTTAIVSHMILNGGNLFLSVSMFPFRSIDLYEN
jgi:hypothetical protein